MDKRIGIDTKNYALYQGGIFNSTAPWVEALFAAHPDWECHGFGPNRGNLRLKVPKLVCRDIELPLNHPYAGYLYNLTSFPRHFSPKGLDLFYSPYYDLLLPKKLPTVITIHDCLYFRFPQFYKAPLVAYYQWIAKRNARWAQKVVTVSQASKNDLIRFLDLPEEKIEVIPNSLGPIWSEAPRPHTLLEELRRTYGSQRLLLYPGGLEARKNLALLAEVVLGLGPEYVLVLTGNLDSYLKAVPGLARLKELGRLAGVGFLELPVLVGLYGTVDAVVYPSLLEGFGFPVLEAQAVGVPIACSNTSSLPEIGGDYPVYFDPTSPEQMAQAIVQAAQSPKVQGNIPVAFEAAKAQAQFVGLVETLVG
ncbi:MAG: hypothetical protein A2600_13965 [Candidatus Lambdaproteobacteria bacterium RIFOXYD1_FULL_56_27]|uniref:Glycosyl transferase family 1 domain-containing protein n=1 Tax=Candidatus Lambdaproteobacteria bacterium RIFOXYD2_FULL_56_26 TaxID=1817773 RepID=A0A1F6GNT5_9PROT|nr:MAG: hypothetical protein A2557_06190 [Candidatus Lambdaproteobacteria bacterium RIFOXYD2_FULL_56_26]OGG99895.1 MAG: hypothetical protein A2426_09925 [Candidatus Lambdaproteobacteria bacterium RIFOXYC1_FULL_56_13]OGH06294.1 MAG: hypothetical protein A2600_13965 [Candidatus Lambdaproteobacteria bacterium RIFOXYD1_FULL_56_27]